MSFQLVAFDILKAKIQSAIKALIEEHKLDSNKVNESIEQLGDERRIQAQVLRKTIDCLDEANKTPEEKARILNAIALYTRDKIALTYSNAYVKTSPENSTLYRCLGTALDINKENNPDSNELFELYDCLTEFLKSETFNEGKSRRGFLPKEKQSFSADKIKGFDIIGEINNLLLRLCKLEIENNNKAVEEAKQIKQEDGKGIKSKSGWFGRSTKTNSKEGGLTSSPTGAL